MISGHSGQQIGLAQLLTTATVKVNGGRYHGYLMAVCTTAVSTTGLPPGTIIIIIIIIIIILINLNIIIIIIILIVFVLIIVIIVIVIILIIILINS